MTGTGDIGGGVSGDEAVWRDLVARFDVPTDRTTAVVPWPAIEDLPEPPNPADLPAGLTEREVSSSEPAASSADSSGASDWTTKPTAGTADPPKPSDQIAGPSTRFAVPVDRTRVIRPADPARSYTPPEEEDERYVPMPLPPPARLDTTSKAALAGVIGGPGYLLVASIFLHWTISAEAALIAVAAFVAGFVTLVVKLGDRPGRDDDDDGAVL
jgi:hypothetical protein